MSENCAPRKFGALLYSRCVEESEPLLERKDTHTDTGGDGDQKIAKVTGSARRKGVNFFRAFLVPGVIVVRSRDVI